MNIYNWLLKTLNLTNKEFLGLFFIVVLGLIIRCFLMFSYNFPVFTPDSYSYIELARFIVENKLNLYQGWRTPGYPLLLFFSVGRFYEIVVGMQVFMDIVVTYFIYDLIKVYSKNVAFFSSIFFFTLLKPVFYELNIITETSTLFFVTLIFWTIVKTKIIFNKANYNQVIWLASLLTFCFLIRPMFIFMAPILAFFMICNLKRKRIKQNIAKVLIIIIFPFSAYFGWSYINYLNNNWFTVTTYSGINLAQRTVRFFYKAPDKYKIIKDIYQKHIDESGLIIKGDLSLTNSNDKEIYSRLIYNPNKNIIEAFSIWRAYEELLKETLLTGPELSKKLYHISKGLILNHPLDYLEGVISSWFYFWLSNDYPINKKYFINEYSSKISSFLFVAQNVAIVFINILLFPLFILAIIKAIRLKKLFNPNTFLICIVLGSSILQSLVTYGGSSRFYFPVVSLIIIFESSFLVCIVKNNRPARINFLNFKN